MSQGEDQHDNIDQNPDDPIANISHPSREDEPKVSKKDDCQQRKLNASGSGCHDGAWWNANVIDP